MGLPFVVLNMVSVLMFKGLGIGDAQIALWTSLIMMPWTLKFLWSPFLEMFKTKKFFVVLTQMVTGAGFALVALALQLPFFFAICIALLAVIAFSGATHDVATDGVYMSELNKQDQAKYIGWQGAFYNIAKIVASGGLVWLAGALLVGFGGVEGATEAVCHEATRHAWMTVMLILAAVMLLLTVILNVVNYVSTDSDLRSTLTLIYENQGTIPVSNQGGGLPDTGDVPPPEQPQGGPNERDGHFTPETPFSTRYFVLRYEDDGTLVLADLTKIASVTDADTAEYLTAALKNGEGYGRCGSYRFFVAHTGDDQNMAIFLDSYQDRKSVV